MISLKPRLSITRHEFVELQIPLSKSLFQAIQTFLELANQVLITRRDISLWLHYIDVLL